MGGESADKYCIQVGSIRPDTPLHPVTLGYSGLEINKLLVATGDVALDYGFGNMANCESSVTYIDGANGILHYRGYPIKKLARESSFVGVAYLLIYGESSDRTTLDLFTRRVKHNRLLPEDFLAFFGAFPSKGHPMSVLQAGMTGLATYCKDILSPLDSEQLEAVTLQLLGKVPTMVVMIAKRAEGLPTLYPDSPRESTGGFIRVTFGLPYRSYDTDPVLIHTLGTLFILHTDHEQSYPASTTRFVGSSRASLYVSVASAVDALSGPLHRDANEAVLRMLIQIEDADIAVAKFVEKVKTKVKDVKLTGFGYRVYKSYDPRAAIVRESARDVLPRLSEADRLLNLTLGLEEVALSNGYFVSRHLYPNVDFYTGLTYHTMGFRMKMFTPLFAIERLLGWIAQYREMITDPSTRITRPHQVYVGAAGHHHRQESAGS